MLKPRFAVLASLILGAALYRLIPHPWNFTPVAAMALFGGAQFRRPSHAFLVVFGALLLSDFAIGFYDNMIWIYGAFAVILGLGLILKKRVSVLNVALASLAGSVLFFVITNFAVWAGYPTYPKTPAGLMACYTAAIPFFRNTVAGDLLFNAVLFGFFHAAKLAFPVLRAESEPARG